MKQTINNLLVLGIESSCDDTSVAVLRYSKESLPDILSMCVLNQDSLHQQYGGVVPEIAARAHSECLDLCTKEVLRQAQIQLNQIDVVAVTAGPGLIGGILSGVSFAKGLSHGLGVAMIGVNHLAAHALTPGLMMDYTFPYLCLLVSGGHCQFLAVLSPVNFLRLGGTVDDAPGEAFDKTARYIGLSQPGGPAIEKLAKNGNKQGFILPRPLMEKEGCDLSFSGLKTAFVREVEKITIDPFAVPKGLKADLCASFQNAVCECLATKSKSSILKFTEHFEQKPTMFTLTGGVAANLEIRKSIEYICLENDIPFYAPPQKYCTDNGAMIAWAGLELYRLGFIDDINLQARSRWPLDLVSEPLIGFGKKGPKA